LRRTEGLQQSRELCVASASSTDVCGNAARSGSPAAL